MHKPIEWKQIARHIAIVTDKPISVARCQQLSDRSMRKIMAALGEDSLMKQLFNDHK
jgi:hypothetical protein